MKYDETLVKRICELLANDSYTILEVCSIVGISDDCFYKWQKEKQEFREAIARARDRFNETMIKEAKFSLRKRVMGYEFDEKRTTYVNNKRGNPIIKEQVNIRKHIQPDMSAIQFVLTNRDSENWKNKQANEITGKDGKDIFRYPIMIDDNGNQVIINSDDSSSTL